MIVNRNCEVVGQNCPKVGEKKRKVKGIFLVVIAIIVKKLSKLSQSWREKKKKRRESSGRADLSEANTITRPHAVDQN